MKTINHLSTFRSPFSTFEPPLISEVSNIKQIKHQSQGFGIAIGLPDPVSLSPDGIRFIGGSDYLNYAPRQILDELGPKLRQLNDANFEIVEPIEGMSAFQIFRRTIKIAWGKWQIS